MKSITNIDGNIIPKTRKPAFACYDNKKLKDYDSDDFAELIFDNSDMNGVFLGIPGLTDKYRIEYLYSIPKDYARVYLYGVFTVIKDCIEINTKITKC